MSTKTQLFDPRVVRAIAMQSSKIAYCYDVIKFVISLEKNELCADPKKNIFKYKTSNFCQCEQAELNLFLKLFSNIV